MARSASTRDGFVFGGGGAEPAGSNVVFAILSPYPELLRIYVPLCARTSNRLTLLPCSKPGKMAGSSNDSA